MGGILLRILHTSDWHLGKNLEGVSRLDEQEVFLQDFIKIVRDNNVDLVIIAGDVYDNSNPPARAEKLFYNTLKNICNEGETSVIIISGNHDNPERLVAASPLAQSEGIIMVGLPKTVIEVGTYGKCEVVDSGEGYIEISINGENAVIITLPYPSEKRLNEILKEEIDENEKRKNYSDRIKCIFDNLSKKYRKDTINIAVSHLFVWGSTSSESERPIQLGGSLAVDGSALPKDAQYIALGHLHRCQKVNIENLPAYYSGSPIQYSKSERTYTNSCFLVDLEPNKVANVDKIMIKNYKPIEVWKCNDVNEAIKKCEENKDRNVWTYLEIHTNEPISQEDIKTMKEIKKDIIEIKPVIEESFYKNEYIEDFREKPMEEVFIEFYNNQRGVQPKEELVEMFLKIVSEGDEDEA